MVCGAFRLFARQVSMLLSRNNNVNVKRRFNVKFVVVCWGGLSELLRLSVVLGDCLQDSYHCFLWTMGFVRGASS